MPDTADDIARRWEAGEQRFSFTTSGSTGTPKIIHHSRALLAWSAAQTGRAIAVSPADHQLICLPLDKTAGFMQVIRSLVWKIPMTVHAPSVDPIGVLPADHPFSIVSLTPAQLFAALRAPGGIELLRRFRVILLGGDSVHPDLEKACLEAGVGFIHTYGMTETASHIALRPAGAAGFRLLDGVEAGIDPEDGHLFIDLQDFPDLGRLHTRDAAEWLPDGSLRIIGRLDHVINSGGVKIAPEPVEAALQASGLLQGRAFALLGVPDAQLGQRCTLLVQGAVFEPEWPRIREICESVQRYSAPKALYFTSEWPLSDNGKLLRRELLAILQRGEAIHFAACS